MPHKSHSQAMEQIKTNSCLPISFLSEHKGNDLRRVTCLNELAVSSLQIWIPKCFEGTV